MNEKLKPCPFCGASGEELGILTDSDMSSSPARRVQCYSCNIEPPFYPDEASAIAAWNRRELERASQLGSGDKVDAARWRVFERALRTGHLRGAAYGRRFKIIETCPVTGDEKEFNAFVEAIDAARASLDGPTEGQLA